MNVVFEVRGATGIATPGRDLTAETADSFREQFIRWLQNEPGVKNVVVDLGEVGFLDSSGLGLLIAMLKRVSELGGDLKIARLSKKARLVFEITRAYKVFDILDTVEEALKACQ